MPVVIYHSVIRWLGCFKQMDQRDSFPIYKGHVYKSDTADTTEMKYCVKKLV